MDDPPVPWTWLDLVRAIVFALGIVAASVLVLALAGAGLRVAAERGMITAGILDPLRPYFIGIFALAVSGLLYGAAVLGIRRYSVQKYRLSWSALYLGRTPVAKYLAMLVLYVPVQLGAGLIVTLQALAGSETSDNPQGDMIAELANQHWLNYVAVFLVVTVVAPIAEEILFRGFLYRLLRKRLPVWAAVPVSALIFAVGHGIPVLIPVLFYLGVVFALVVERTRSLGCSIALHAVHNAAAFVAMALALRAGTE
jgi:membrane protease YdiL (CAAX protease family)